MEGESGGGWGEEGDGISSGKGRVDYDAQQRKVWGMIEGGSDGDARQRKVWGMGGGIRHNIPPHVLTCL